MLPFERNANLINLDHLGDPERWGGTDTITLAVGVGAPAQAFGRQFIRAQVPHLLARAWDLAGSYVMEGFDSINDQIVICALEVTFGVGSSSQSILVNCDGRLDPPVNGSLLQTLNGGGGFAAARPIPGAAIAVRPLLSLTSVAALHTISVSFSAGISPRSV